MANIIHRLLSRLQLNTFRCCPPGFRVFPPALYCLVSILASQSESLNPLSVFGLCCWSSGAEQPKLSIERNFQEKPSTYGSNLSLFSQEMDDNQFPKLVTHSCQGMDLADFTFFFSFKLSHGLNYWLKFIPNHQIGELQVKFLVPKFMRANTESK